MLVSGFPAGPPGTNCFVVAPGPGERCVVIDPGIDAAGPLEELLAQHRLQPGRGAADPRPPRPHVLGGAGVRCPGRAGLDPPGRPRAADRPADLAGAPPGTPLMGMPSLPTAEPADVRELADGEDLELAGLSVGVRHTPGHTLGSVVFTARHAGRAAAVRR